MNSVMTEVEKKRTILVPVDEFYCFKIAPVDKIFFVGQALFDFQVEVIWMKVAAATDASVFRDNHFVKTMLAGRKFLSTVVG
ncbi:MAG: hypothetical protein ACYSWZ_24835, partial [Planctomycetota bacterium]